MISPSIVIEYLYWLFGWVWTERLFLTSLATLLAVGYLSYQAHEYEQKISEPPNFQVERAYLRATGSELGSFLSFEIRNAGRGRCGEFKIDSFYYFRGDKSGEEALRRPVIETYIEPGESFEKTIKPAPGYEDCGEDNRLIRLFYLADGKRGNLTITPDDYTDEHWFIEKSSLS